MFSQGWEFTILNITQKFWNKHSDELQKQEFTFKVLELVNALPANDFECDHS